MTTTTMTENPIDSPAPRTDFAELERTARIRSLCASIAALEGGRTRR